MRFWTFSLLVLFGVASLPGCSGAAAKAKPTGTVSGKVTSAGKPLTITGTVLFNPTAPDGVLFGAELDKTGNYKVAGPVGLGTYTVNVEPPGITPETKDKPPVDASAIPQKYRNGQKSGYTVEVKKGANKFDIDMVP